MLRVFRLSDSTRAIISQFYGVYSSAQRLNVHSAAVRERSPHSGEMKTILETPPMSDRSKSYL